MAFEFLIQHGCIKPPTFCASCNAQLRKKKRDSSDGYILVCRNSSCQKSYSPRNGSWFEGTRIDFNILLMLIYCWCFEFTNKQTIRETDLAKQSITDFFNMFRQVCFDRFGKISKIGGPGCVVQVDESHVYTGKYNVGRVLKSE